MSKAPAPSPKANFMQTLLLMLTIFLGFQLFFGAQNRTVTGTADEILAQMKTSNARLLDHTILTQYNQYKGKLGELERNKDIDAKTRDQRELEGLILVADTQLKAGLARNDTNRIRTAYHTLEKTQRHRMGDPVWEAAFPVTLPESASTREKYDWKEWKGPELYQKVVTEISNRNKTDLIWGAIPGGYQLVDFLVTLTGSQPGFSYAFAAFLLAIAVRAVVFPLAEKQLYFGRQMSQLSPLLKEIQEKYKDDRQQYQVKSMELYKEYGINPAAGCLPMLIQLPLFFTVYQCMLHYQFEFEKGTFLWVNPAMAQATNGFIAPNLGRLDYILIVVYGISMIVTTLLMPVSDPTQIKQQRMIGIGVALFATVTMFFDWFPVPAGFVLYWIFLNILSTAQSLRAYRQPLPPLRKVNAPGGGVFPMDPTTALDKLNGKPKGTGKPATHKPKKRK